MKTKIAGAALTSLLVLAVPAQAATYSVSTIYAGGSYAFPPDYEPFPDDVSFSFLASGTDPAHITVTDGTFAGFYASAMGLGAADESVLDGLLTISNGDGATLQISFASPAGLAPVFAGDYRYTDPSGSFGTGSFAASISAVPLPASAPMLGGGLLALAISGRIARRRRVAQASKIAG